MSNIWDMIRVVLFGSHNDASRDGAPAFIPAQDIPLMAGKVILLTGAAAIELARYGRPSRIYIADLPRSDDAKQDLIRQINYEAYRDPISISPHHGDGQCAQKFAAQEQHLDILILNAGIIRGHISAPKEGVDFDLVKTNCSNLPYPKSYGQCKAALIGLMKGLSRDCPQIKTVAIHPGRIPTGMATSLWKESSTLTKPIAPFFCVLVTIGIRNHLWAATSLKVVIGTYYEPVGVPGRLEDQTFADRL
ncbi:uncharacterized protein P174DRAFT_487702 [Aspergillus novofumigatus IBT 16806]|uniref:NAD(P)-binding protein n=1 Tax=Aspergillus novofumigatus (strain IBT 16806) TaxID=1392255 RepID=A0A2I1C3S0_ASPN1|nr:uncharacterized protein P174DRAFT_487702 [Aspergillus novofumigatus IBT 16806]PKX92287.1 hypothetical protein P174DRAFT_487702 [Aspergillus novofumigatus IBT 16806]